MIVFILLKALFHMVDEIISVDDLEIARTHVFDYYCYFHLQQHRNQDDKVSDILNTHILCHNNKKRRIDLICSDSNFGVGV